MSDALDILTRLVSERRAAPLVLDVRATALVVVDMQRYFLSADSPYSRFLEHRAAGYTRTFLAEVEEHVLPRLRSLVGAFRAARRPVLWTALAAAQAEGNDLPKRLRELNAAARNAGMPAAVPARDDHWAGFPDALSPAAGEPVVQKTTFGGFANGVLDGMLRERGLHTLVLCGVVTNVCVETTAREAVDRGYSVIIAEDACAAYAPEVHRTHLDSFEVAFGSVRPVQDVLSALRAPPTP